ncbi:MAG TPA: putative Se/S carrier-like protein [Candidatus Elarobacter sp.]|jgi:hypothetical protein|nr:putative Se/S carrier-like protein [Candidatus Elarobacter sp.]
MAHVILLFASNSGTMVATKALRDSGVAARMIPTPAGTPSASNLSLSIDRAAEAAALAALGHAKVSVASVVR